MDKEISTKYSFIVPIYNAEIYLQKCIESIISQQGDYELILIDDGSTDRSGKICDKYAEEHKNIFVYHISNGGVANARNLGVAKAIGKYIIFVDSDDYIAENFIEYIDNADISTDADVIFYNSLKYFEDSNTYIPLGEGLNRSLIHKKSKVEVLEHISNCSKLPASICGKILRRSFLLENKIEFPNIIGEDIDYLLNLLYYGKRFDMLDFNGYFYRIKTASRHSSGRTDSVDALIQILQEWSKKIKYYEFKEYFLSYLAYEYAMLLHYFGALSKEDKRKYITSMRQLSYLFGYGKGKKIKLIKMLLKCIGINLTSNLLFQYLRIRDGG